MLSTDKWNVIHSSDQPRWPSVTKQIEFDPDIGGVWFGSIMIQLICAFGFLGGTNKFTCRNRSPRVSLSTKFLNLLSDWINLASSQIVPPSGGATPPTITSPTSPSAWQPMICLDFEVLIYCTPWETAGLMIIIFWQPTQENVLHHLLIWKGWFFGICALRYR